MQYTSGTTGRPTGVTTGLWSEATARAVYEDEAEVWDFEPSDLHLVCSPMDHIVSIRFSANTLLAGGSLAILSRFDAGTALETLRWQRSDDRLPRRDPPAAHPSTGRPRGRRDLRLVAAAAAARRRRRALPREHQASDHGTRPARRRLGVLRVDRGAVHGVLTRRLARAPGHRRARPGRRLPARRAGDVVDEVPTDPVDEVEGAIWCDQPDFARFTYWRNPEATANAWRGSACTVGDLGRLDSDGFLYLTGRRHEPHHQRRRQRVPRRDRERALRRAGRQRSGGVRSSRRAVGPEGLCRLRDQHGVRW